MNSLKNAKIWYPTYRTIMCLLLLFIVLILVTTIFVLHDTVGVDEIIYRSSTPISAGGGIP